MKTNSVVTMSSQQERHSLEKGHCKRQVRRRGPQQELRSSGDDQSEENVGPKVSALNEMLQQNDATRTSSREKQHVRQISHQAHPNTIRSSGLDSLIGAAITIPMNGTHLSASPPSSAEPPSAASTIQQTSHNFPAHMTDRSRFLVFVKVLLRYLAKSNIPRLEQKAKHVIADCTRRQKAGTLRSNSLSEEVELQLKPVLGNELWGRICTYFNFVMERNAAARSGKSTTLVAAV